MRSASSPRETATLQLCGCGCSCVDVGRFSGAQGEHTCVCMYIVVGTLLLWWHSARSRRIFVTWPTGVCSDLGSRGWTDLGCGGWTELGSGPGQWFLWKGWAFGGPRMQCARRSLLHQFIENAAKLSNTSYYYLNIPIYYFNISILGVVLTKKMTLSCNLITDENKRERERSFIEREVSWTIKTCLRVSR